MSRAMRKCVLCHMRTTKAQISLHIRETLVSFCGCVGRFVSGLVGKSRTHVLSCRGSNKVAMNSNVKEQEPKIRVPIEHDTDIEMENHVENSVEIVDHDLEKII